MQWSFKPTGAQQRVEFPESDLCAVVFSPVLRPDLPQESTNQTACNLVLRDGTALRAAKMEHHEGHLRIQTVGGMLVDSFDPPAQFLPAIVEIWSQPKNVQWLSRMEPARYRWLPSAGNRLDWPLGRDRDLFGEPLFDKNSTMRHSLTMHAPSQAAYRWDGSAGKFLSEVSLWSDPRSSEPLVGSAICKVLVGRNQKLDEVFRSETLRPGAKPQAVTVDITGGQLVVLLSRKPTKAQSVIMLYGARHALHLSASAYDGPQFVSHRSGTQPTVCSW